MGKNFLGNQNDAISFAKIASFWFPGKFFLVGNWALLCLSCTGRKIYETWWVSIADLRQVNIGWVPRLHLFAQS